MLGLAPDNLFDLKLNAEGILALQNCRRIARWCLIAGVVAASLLFLSNLVYLLGPGRSLRSSGGKDLSTLYYSYFHPVLGMADSVLLIVQFYLFNQFGRSADRAVRENDELQLNEALGALVRFSRLMIVQLVYIMMIYLLSFIFMMTRILHWQGKLH